MKKIAGLGLLLVGGILLFQGFSRKDSLVGGAAEVGTKIANKVDGGTRVPEHTMYLVAGGVLVLAGLVAVLRKPS